MIPSTFLAGADNLSEEAAQKAEDASAVVAAVTAAAGTPAVTVSANLQHTEFSASVPFNPPPSWEQRREP